MKIFESINKNGKNNYKIFVILKSKTSHKGDKT